MTDTTTKQTFAATKAEMDRRVSRTPRHYDCADCDRIDMSERDTMFHYITSGHYTKA